MEYNDYELVFLAQEKDEIANDILYKKYENVIYNKSRKVFNYLRGKGVELCDVVQEATIGFAEAIMAYNQDDKALFYTFACVCIDRKLTSFILKQSRDKYKFLNDAVTLDYDDVSLYNVFSDKITPETELFDSVDSCDLYIKLKNVLTDMEDIVFELKIFGFNYKEISSILDVDNKFIYNAVNRIRKKLNKILCV